ncbi:hypothetical protein PHMEG_00022655 [Phytophthora megakarya]|uniref:Uncharacterized protein n=1 Tax=Phytophthora megakarya TaxID=4795 RepID=A0A225VJJ1_9STRA|nr:hypothetical protein PHMEG_00022655 [Phytophthora megakarya]
MKASIKCITTKNELKAQQDAQGGKLLKGNVLGVHFQFASAKDAYTDTDSVELIAVADTLPTPNVVVLRSRSGQIRKAKALKMILEDPSVIKVLYNVRRIARWLYRYGIKKNKQVVVSPVNCVDLQLLQTPDWTKPNASLLEIVSQFCSPQSSDLARQVETFDWDVQNAISRHILFTVDLVSVP